MSPSTFTSQIKWNIRNQGLTLTLSAKMHSHHWMILNVTHWAFEYMLQVTNMFLHKRADTRINPRFHM